MGSRAPPPGLTALAGIGIFPCLLAFSLLPNDRNKLCVVVSAMVSLLGFFATKALIPVLLPVHLRRNLFGMDINKKGADLNRSCSDSSSAAKAMHDVSTVYSLIDNSMLSFTANAEHLTQVTVYN